MSFPEYLLYSWEHIFELAVEHAQVVLLSLFIATVLGVFMGILVYRRERAMKLTLAVTGALATIPSYALFGLLIPFLGLGYKPTVVALVMYALLPIVRNTTAGLRSVDPAIVESATGMGMAVWGRLLRIEMPLAWPVIVAGVRVSGMLLMGIAAIAAAVNGPGLGNDIFSGLARIGSANAVNFVLGGIFGIVALALLLDGSLMLLGKLTTSRGIRG
ncbi:ABC transporter permease [soil metagenome]